MSIGASALNERYCLAAFEDGGLLLDLEAGGYYDVNASAAWLLERALAHGIDAAVHAGAARWNVSAELIEADLRRMLPPRLELSRRTRNQRLELDADSQSVTLVCDRRPVLKASIDGGVELLAPPGDLPLSPAALVHAILPEAACLLGVDLLHAAAVKHDQRVFAFSGSSGAGKTTTAAAVVRAGGRLLADDVLVLSPRAEAAVVLDTDQSTRGWEVRACEVLLQGSSMPLDGLLGIDRGESVPLDSILFLDVARRRGDRFVLETQSRARTATAVFENVFLGGVTRSGWRRHLATAARVAGSTRGFRVVAPAGLHAVDRAAGELRTILAAL